MPGALKLPVVVKHAQILLKLDKRPENEEWTYDRIKDAYGASHSTIAGVAKRFVMEGMESALGRKEQKNRCRKTGEVEAQIYLIACSEPPEGAARWTIQMIAEELIRPKVVDYITDSTVCEVMKETKSSRGRSGNGASQRQTRDLQQKWRMCWRCTSVLGKKRFALIQAEDLSECQDIRDKMTLIFLPPYSPDLKVCQGNS